MKKYFRSLASNIEEISLGKRYHFNKVFAPEWAIAYKRLVECEQEPYSLVFQHLMLPVRELLYYDFCHRFGTFTHALKFVSVNLARQILSIYVCYTVSHFLQSQFCRDLAKFFPDYDGSRLWQIVICKLPESRVYKEEIENYKVHGEKDIFPWICLQVHETIKKQSGQKLQAPDPRKWLSSRIVYSEYYRSALDLLEDELAGR